ncbi:MAG: hypothetical protein IT326_06320 [Anaerolineae bacterium]|nr:hypothetical protein [Anaerolineae bacterium]
MPSFARALADYDPDLLRIIASQWDIDLVATDRLAAADELTNAVLRQEAVDATWVRLPADEQGALADLMLAGGKQPYGHFVRRYGELRLMGPARREREKPWLAPVSVTESLYYRGLVIRAFEQTANGPQEYAIIPDDLLAFLPQPARQEHPRAPGFAVAPPRVIERGMPCAPDDLATLLSYLMIRDTHAAAWLQNAPIPEIDRHLRRPDAPAYRVMLVQLAYDLGLIVDERFMTHTSTRVIREVARPWLEAPRAHQNRSLAETWVSSVTWNDLAFTPGIEADTWPNKPRAARRFLLDVLSHVPIEIWWSLDSLVEHVRQNDPDFQRPGGDYAAWYLRDAYTGEILHGFQYWDLIDGALLRFLINGPMRWLGMVHAGHGAFALTESGAALLGRADWRSDPDPPSSIIIDPQGVISVPPGLSRYERLQIARFTAWNETPPAPRYIPLGQNRDDGLYRYRLTPQALARVTGDGIEIPSHIIPFLQRLSSHQAPTNVLRMLEAWHNTPREVVVQDVVVLRARDLNVAQRLRKNRQIGNWLGHQIEPNAYVIKREDMPALLNALRAMGVLPFFEGHEKDDWP